jgi:predicted Zn finger-like uncharacterized protein
MALTKITCPECQTVLRPAKPVPAGKTVKCPECGNRFTAEEEPEAPPRKPKKSASPITRERDEGEPVDARKPQRPADGKAAPKKPAKKPAAPADLPIPLKNDDEDDGGGPTYGFVDSVEAEDKQDIEYAPNMSIKDLRGPAHGALVRPSNMMILVGGLGFFGWVALLIIILIPALTPIDNDESDKSKPAKPVIGLEHGLGALRDEKEPPADVKSDPNRKSMLEIFGVNIGSFGTLAWYLFLLVLLPCFVGMVYCGFIAYGAVRIQNLEGRGWGIASCILMMLPITSFGLMADLGLLSKFLVSILSDDIRFVYLCVVSLISLAPLASIGVGVWGLTTLLSEKVVKGFEYKAE